MTRQPDETTRKLKTQIAERATVVEKLYQSEEH
jgi:hypothetical protein